MMLRASTVFLVLLTGTALGACQGGVSEKPPVHWNQNMDQQHRFEAQEENPYFEDGRAMRPRIEGTVAWGHLDADDHIYRGTVDGAFARALPAEAPEGQPLALDRALLERGQERYQIFCTPCHDGTGSGNGIVVERGMMKPPSLHDERAMAMPIGQLYDVVTNGIRNMPGYGKQVQLRDRWAITAYVRALQLSRNAGLDDVPADRAGSERWEIR